MIWIESVITGRSSYHYDHTTSSQDKQEKKKKNNINVGNNRYRTTGKLGDVMRESAEISYTYAKTLSLKLDPENTFFDDTVLHTHFPEGSIPKDGPSAGCAIVTSLLSLLFNKSVESHTAMTGEITLTGKVLPVGGIKEKIMAAKRCSINRV